MITTDALKYLPQMDLDPLRVVGCAAAKCQNSFALANGFAVEAIVAEKFSIAFGWLLSQRDPIDLSCEGVMRQPEVPGWISTARQPTANGMAACNLWFRPKQSTSIA